MKPKLILLCVLIPLIAGLALPGCKSPPETAEASAQKFTRQLRDAVSGNVADSGRKDQMLALVDQMETTQQTYNQDVAAFVASFRQLNTSYDTPRATFDELFKAFDAQRVAARDRFLDVHFQLTTLATAGEWKKIGKAEKKLYEDLLKPRAQPDEEDAS